MSAQTPATQAAAAAAGNKYTVVADKREGFGVCATITFPCKHSQDFHFATAADIATSEHGKALLAAKLCPNCQPKAPLSSIVTKS